MIKIRPARFLDFNKGEKEVAETVFEFECLPGRKLQAGNRKISSFR